VQTLIGRIQTECSLRGILRLKRNCTCADTISGLAAKRTSPFKTGGGVSSVDYWRPMSADRRVAIV